MSSYPPPYPPPPGTPFGPPYGPPQGIDPRQQVRLAREQRKAQNQAQARAQKEAYKAQARQAVLQRDALRQQSRAHRRSSVLTPLLIISIGVVALLLRTGRIPAVLFASWYTRWWPLLLVGAGVILAMEWAIDQMPHADGTPSDIRRGVGSGAVLLILTLAITGIAVSSLQLTQNLFADGFNLNARNFENFFGEKHELTQQLDAVLPPNASLIIDNPHGDVTLVGHSGDDQVRITASKEVFTSSEQSADEKGQQISPQIALTGSILTISVPSVDGASANLILSVPDRGDTTVTVNHGAINISAMHAPVTVTANHGDIDFHDIAGPVTAHINHRNSSLTARNITGDLAVRGHAQDLSLTDVSGQVSLEGEFFGNTHLERLHGPVSFHTNRTQFSIARLDGEVDMSPDSELTGNQLIGPTRLRTSSRNISFERIAGDLDLTNSKGSVDITSAAPLGNVTIQNRDGAVNLTVPDHAPLTLDAATHGGQIENSLGLSSSSSQNDNSSLQGKLGDGAAQIMIRTTHFNIDIRKADLAPPAPPAPPLSPTAPAPRSAKPLKTT